MGIEYFKGLAQLAEMANQKIKCSCVWDVSEYCRIHGHHQSVDCAGCADHMPTRERFGKLWHIYEGDTSFGRECTSARNKK